MRNVTTSAATANIMCTYLFGPICGYPLAGQEGLEPPTHGFGDRCSTIRATALYFLATPLLRFLVVGVLAAPIAELRELELLGARALVLRRGVVPLAALLAFERDDDACRCHGS